MKKFKCKIPEGVSGDWSIEKITVPKFSIERLRLAMAGRDCPPGTYTRLMHKSSFNNCVMSDTPAEISDLYPLKMRCELKDESVKRVLINGLGLGVAVQMILRNKHIEHVDVVELSPDVINLVAPHIKDERVSIHAANALEIEWGKGLRWDLVWHDIWPNIPNSDDRPTIARLKRKYQNRCRWQGVWCEHYSRF